MRAFARAWARARYAIRRRARGGGGVKLGPDGVGWKHVNPLLHRPTTLRRDRPRGLLPLRWRPLPGRGDPRPALRRPGHCVGAPRPRGPVVHRSGTPGWHLSLPSRPRGGALARPCLSLHGGCPLPSLRVELCPGGGRLLALRQRPRLDQPAGPGAHHLRRGVKWGPAVVY